MTKKRPKDEPEQVEVRNKSKPRGESVSAVTKPHCSIQRRKTLAEQNKPKPRKPQSKVAKIRENKRLRKIIRKLAWKVIRGDKKAETKIQKYLSNPLAAQEIQKVMKEYQELKKRGLASNAKFKTRKPMFGNAFKPYQGGLPGLGKKS